MIKLNRKVMGEYKKAVKHSYNLAQVECPTISLEACPEVTCGGGFQEYVALSDKLKEPFEKDPSIEQCLLLLAQQQGRSLAQVAEASHYEIVWATPMAWVVEEVNIKMPKMSFNRVYFGTHIRFHQMRDKGGNLI